MLAVLQFLVALRGRNDFCTERLLCTTAYTIGGRVGPGGGLVEGQEQAEGTPGGTPVTLMERNL